MNRIGFVEFLLRVTNGVSEAPAGQLHGVTGTGPRRTFVTRQRKSTTLTTKAAHRFSPASRTAPFVAT